MRVQSDQGVRLLSMSLSATSLLAIIGAATGVSSATVELVRFVRERRAFHVSFTTSTKQGHVPWAAVTVLNKSTVGHYVKEVGFFAQRKQLEVLNDDESVKATFSADIKYVLADSQFLEPGEFKAFEGFPDPIDQTIMLDKPIRSYAIDSRNRWHWGSAGPVFRLMVGDSAPPADEPDYVKALFEPRPELLPEQVVPRWKIWRKKELRVPRAYRFTKRDRDPGKVVVTGRVVPGPGAAITAELAKSDGVSPRDPS